jgi:hypothetical protein
LKFLGRYSIFYKYAIVKAADKFGEDLFFERTGELLVKSKRVLRQWRVDLDKVILPQPKIITINYYGFREDWVEKQLRLAEKDMLLSKNFLHLEPSGIRSLIKKFQLDQGLTSKEKKCLFQMGVLDSDGLTKLGETYITSGKSLKSQCEKLGISLSRVELSIQNQKVEHALLRHLSGDANTRWFYIENQFYHFIFMGLIQPIYAQLGINSSGCVFENDMEEELIGCFTLNHFNSTIEQMAFENTFYEDRYGNGYSTIETGSLIKIYKAIGYDFFKMMAVFEFRHSQSCHIGWPDLIGVNNAGIRFIEVKKNDNLTFGQVRNFPLIIEQGLELNVCVVNGSRQL